MMKKLKTALLGLGRIGWQYHLPQIACKDEFDLVGVVDPLADRLVEARNHYGVAGYSHYQQLFAEQHIDLVVIASPTPFHHEHALASFAAGCDVFCEKPAAKDLEEFDSICQAAKRAGRKLMTYQPHRISKETVALRSILSQGKLGPIYMIRRNWFEYSRRNDWQSLKVYGGGMLANYGSHFVDQLLYLTEYGVASVNCVTRNVISPGDAEDFAKILIETHDKTILDIEINLASAHALPCWQILGKYGSAVLDEQSQSWQLKYCNPAHLMRIDVNRSLAAHGRQYRNGESIEWIEESVSYQDTPELDYYDKCYEHFALDRPAFVPLEQTRELMRVLDCCNKTGSFAAVPQPTVPLQAVAVPDRSKHKIPS